MTSSELAAWVQAFGSIAALVVAIGVPWYVHWSEQRAARLVKDSYKSLLLEAFERLREPIVYLDAINEFSPADGEIHDPAGAATQLSSAIAKMQDILVVIREIEDVKRLDDFNAILTILKLRPNIEAAVPSFEKEARWLRDHGSSPRVVSSAVATLGHHAHELRAGIDAVLAALKDRSS